MRLLILIPCKKLDAIMGSGGLVVMDENTCMVEVARFFMSVYPAGELRQVCSVP